MSRRAVWRMGIWCVIADAPLPSPSTEKNITSIAYVAATRSMLADNQVPDIAQVVVR